MNRNISITMAIVFGLVFLTGVINACGIEQKNTIINFKNKSAIFNINQKTNLLQQKDVVRCTCDGKVCSGTQNGSPGAPAGSLLVNCTRICSCSGKIGFLYEAEK